MIYVSCLNFWVLKKKCKLQELLLLLLCCHFCSFLLLLLWSWQNLWQKNSVFRQSLTWWKKNPKDCVLAVHGGRPKLQYIKCHPNFLVCFAQLWWRWKLAWKRSLISSYNVLFFIKAALCTCSVIFKIRVHRVGVIAVHCTMKASSLFDFKQCWFTL